MRRPQRRPFGTGKPAPLLPFLLSILLLCGFARPQVRIAPVSPVLGTPFRVTISLPEDARLAGLPELSPFVLLEPPRREEGGMQLMLMALRPGRHRLPSLPFDLGATGRLSTAPVDLEIAEGVAADARPALLMELPGPPPSFPYRAVTAATLFACGLVLLWRMRRPPPREPPLESLPSDELLAGLARRLARRCDSPEALELAAEIERLRFSPLQPSEEQARQLLQRYRQCLLEDDTGACAC